MVKLIPDKKNVGKLETDLLEKADKYSDLTGSTRIELIRNLLTDFLEDKVLDNDFIELSKPFYFNMNKLKEDGIVKASTKEPIHELEKTFLLFNVPNNLDSFNTEANSYCFKDNIHLHRGYYILTDFHLELVFSYDSKANELEIAISNNRDLYFSLEQKEEKEKLVTEKEIYVPELESYIVVDYEGLNLIKYSDYKYLVLEQEERYKEQAELIEKIEKQEE